MNHQQYALLLSCHEHERPLLRQHLNLCLLFKMALCDAGRAVTLKFVNAALLEAVARNLFRGFVTSNANAYPVMSGPEVGTFSTTKLFNIGPPSKSGQVKAAVVAALYFIPCLSLLAQLFVCKGRERAVLTTALFAAGWCPAPALLDRKQSHLFRASKPSKF